MSDRALPGGGPAGTGSPGQEGAYHSLPVHKACSHFTCVSSAPFSPGRRVPPDASSGLLPSQHPGLGSSGFVVSVKETHTQTHTYRHHINNSDITTVLLISYLSTMFCIPHFPLYWFNFPLCQNKSSSNIFFLIEIN